ncbi:MAG: hypothetical protein IJV07_01720 [Alphaproteobacteria bacterium]|nr:hypothetical protein [Alphaproteobacteria bacterium]
MLEYSEIIQKIKAGRHSFRDQDGDTLLHSLIKCEEQKTVPVEPAIVLLSKHPEFANIKNKFGQIPSDLFDGWQLHTHSSNRPLRRLLYPFIDDPIKKEHLEKSIYMSFIEQLAHSDEREHDYRIISSDEADTLLKHPVVLLFSGRGNYALPLISGFARKFRKTLGILQTELSKVKIISVRYPGNNRDLCNDYMISHQQTPDKPENDHPLLYVIPFVERYLRPMYLDEYGRKKSLSQVMRHMRRLNLVGYSYGSGVIQFLSEVLTQDMLENGFNEKEVIKAQSQILAFHIAPDLNRYHYRNYFRSYHLLNMQDDVVFEPLRELLPQTKSENWLIGKTFFGRQKNHQILLINTLENNTEHAPHHIGTYSNPVNEAQKIAISWERSILFNGINNSIQNEGTSGFIPLPQDLEKIPDKLLFMKQKNMPFRIKIAQYQQQISAAEKIRFTNTIRQRE